MQARIIVPAPNEPVRYLELCLHHNNVPEWEWRIAPTSALDGTEQQISSLAGPITAWHLAPHSLRTLGTQWTTLDPLGREWVREQLLAPIIAQLTARLDHVVRDPATLCGSLAELYPAMAQVLEQAQRDYLFTATTLASLTARWLRQEPNLALPDQDTPLILEGILQLFTPDRTALLMQCAVERWQDGLYWVSSFDEESMGAFIPGPMMAYLDCLPVHAIDQEEAGAARPVALHPDLQAWLISTIIWPDEIHPDPDHVIEHLRKQAEELSPTAIGRPGQRYSKALAFARVMKNQSIEEYLHGRDSFE